MSKTSSNSSGNSQHPELPVMFLTGLNELFWAEKQQVAALPKLQQAASSIQLKATIEDHLAQTRDQVERLEKISQIFNEELSETSTDKMSTLLKEVENSTDDAAIITSLQKIEQYELYTYGTLEQLANSLGYDEVAELLKLSMEEERLADMNLAELTESNNEASKE